MTWASLVYLPAVLLVTALAVLLFGLLPGASGLAWVAVAFAFLIGWLGSLLEFPQWVDNLSPFTHTPAVPAESVVAGPLLVLALLTLAAIVVGWAGFRRRDIGRG